MERKPTAAFVLSLLAGIWMLSMGGMMYGMGPGLRDNASGFWGYCFSHGMMRTVGPALWVPWFGPLAGSVLIIAAISLYTKPELSQTWGLVIVVAATIDLFVGMGGFVAAILGIVGGSLALSWKVARHA